MRKWTRTADNIVWPPTIKIIDSNGKAKIIKPSGSKVKIGQKINQLCADQRKGKILCIEFLQSKD